MKVCCKWCNGTGRMAVEIGSSQTYRCTDCSGTGQWTNPEYDLTCDDDPDEDDANDS